MKNNLSDADAALRQASSRWRLYEPVQWVIAEEKLLTGYYFRQHFLAGPPADEQYGWGKLVISLNNAKFEIPGEQFFELPGQHSEND